MGGTESGEIFHPHLTSTAQTLFGVTKAIFHQFGTASRRGQFPESCGALKPVAIRIARRGAPAFTLVELLAVVMVILMLSAIMVGVARFVGRKGDISQTRADLAGLALAIDSFKLDTGGYPATTTARVSCVFYGGLVAAHARPGPAEVNNSAALYSNLTANGRAYIRFRKDQIQKTNIFTIASVGH